MFSEIFRTHTLRLVSPWGHPGTYPIAHYTAYPSGGHPMAKGLQEATIQPRGASLQPGTAPPVPPTYPTFRNRHTHGTQHPRKAPGATQTTRLQYCKHSQPTESITKSPESQIQRKAWQRWLQRKAQQRQYREKPDKEAKYRHLIYSGITSRAGWHTDRHCVWKGGPRIAFPKFR